MQLAAEHAARIFRTQGIAFAHQPPVYDFIGENRRAGKTELAEFFEPLLQVLLRLAELRAVAFVENKHHLLVVNRQAVFRFHQIV